jgi:N-dimethylarginine dimethylaminohydrolase
MPTCQPCGPKGVDVVYLDEISGGRMKSCYTRDAVIAVAGGAIVMRLGARIRRGEELPVTARSPRLGCPILRTISGAGIAEGGSFAWLTRKAAVIGLSSRVNEEGARQIEEVLRSQGVELLKLQLTGYRLHLGGLFVNNTG